LKANTADISFTVPAELAHAPAAREVAKARSEKLPRSHRHEYIRWIASAKPPGTRQRRAAKAVDMLTSPSSTR
jgi:uncharacterized protein YdeI (YjbR/CyaY-like superfamily)